MQNFITSGNNHSNMLSPQDKGPIFNDMKCHCGVYSSLCVFFKELSRAFWRTRNMWFFSPFFRHSGPFHSIIWNWYMMNMSWKHCRIRLSELHIISFCIFCQVFMQWCTEFQFLFCLCLKCLQDEIVLHLMETWINQQLDSSFLYKDKWK